MATNDAPTSEEFVPRWEVVKNIDSIAIPPFAVVEIGPFQSNNVFGVKRPTADSLPYVMVVNEGGIPVGGEGMATFNSPAAVLCNSSDGTPAPGTAWGTKANSFKLGATSQGFIALQSISSGLGVFRYSTATGVGDIVKLVRFESPTSTDSTGKCLSAYTEKFLTIDPTDDELIWARIV